MPEVEVCSSSVLLTPAGWAIAARLGREADIAGVDAAGRVAIRTVNLRVAGVGNRRCFLGTRSSFGPFAETTRILLHDGTSLSALDIVTDHPVVGLRFETCSDIPTAGQASAVAGLAWLHICAAGVRRSEDRVWLTCRGSPADPVDPSLFSRAGVTFVETGALRFCIVERTGFLRAAVADWASTVELVAAAWATVGSTNDLEWEREHAVPALWYLSARRSKGQAAGMFFDSLQHSACVSAGPAYDPPHSIVRGECAFVAPGATKVLLLSWVESSWSPISAGFLLTYR